MPISPNRLWFQKDPAPNPWSTRWTVSTKWRTAGFTDTQLPWNWRCPQPERTTSRFGATIEPSGVIAFRMEPAHENASSDPDAETKIEEFWTPLTKTVQLSEDASPLRLVRVPRGSFSMGSPVAEADRAEDEAQHSVTLSQSFYMSQFEITQGQWTALMDANPSQFSGEPNRPVENVFLVRMPSLHRGTEFAGRRRRRVSIGDGSGMGIRLPRR